MTLHIQFYTLGMMAFSGMMLGTVFDTYRVLAGQLLGGRRRLLIPFFDVIYWIASTVFVFRMLYASNQGQLRLFVFIGLAVGVFLYWLALSKLTIQIVKGILLVVKATIRFLIHLFDWVIIRPIILLIKFFRILLGFLLVIAVFLGKIMVQLLYPVYAPFRFLYRVTIKRLPRPKWLRRIRELLYTAFNRLKRGFWK